MQQFETPVEATTTSLEALNNYSMGLKIRNEKGSAASIPFLKRAVQLDPNFPLAYTALAVGYSNLRQPSLALQYATRAYDLRDRVTERERLRITTTYLRMTGETEKNIPVYGQWIASYPRDQVPHINLGITYAEIGQHEKALAEMKEAVRLAPDSRSSAYSALESRKPGHRDPKWETHRGTGTARPYREKKIQQCGRKFSDGPGAIQFLDAFVRGVLIELHVAITFLSVVVRDFSRNYVQEPFVLAALTIPRHVLFANKIGKLL